MSSQWYIVHAYSNFERKVADEILALKQNDDMKDAIEDVMVPVEKVAQMRRGKKTDTKRRFFPGYVLVKMDMNDRTHHAVKNLPKVTGFLGADNKPAPVPQSEIDHIKKQVQEGVERPHLAITFEVGEQVRVADGPFASYHGIVEEVNIERARLKVSVSIFGRSTPVDLEYTQVEKS